MGDIKKIKKKYSKPSHPWMMARIEEESALCRDFGIPRRTELWKTRAKLESFKNQAKLLSALTTAQAEKEKHNLMVKLESLGLLAKGASTDEILGIELKDALNRRLQTFVFKRGLAKSMKQARQMITHRHILVGGKLNTSPSYLVKVSEDASIALSAKSAFYDNGHPERVKEATKRKPRVQDKKTSFKKRKK